MRSSDGDQDIDQWVEFIKINLRSKEVTQATLCSFDKS